MDCSSNSPCDFSFQVAISSRGSSGEGQRKPWKVKPRGKFRVLGSEEWGGHRNASRQVVSARSKWTVKSTQILPLRTKVEEMSALHSMFHTLMKTDKMGGTQSSRQMPWKCPVLITEWELWAAKYRLWKVINKNLNES